MSQFYRVYLTPLISNNTYSSTEIDVTDRVKDGGVSVVRRSIDAGDYDVGVYTYDDMTITVLNYDGFWSDVDDSRSVFIYSRDRAKIRVAFAQVDTSGAETETTMFRGVISDEASRANLVTNEIKLRVLNNLSIIRNQKVTPQAIGDGTSVKTALVTILSNARAESILTIDSANINPDLNIDIDDGSFFDDKPLTEAVNLLLLVSNSAMLVNSSDEVIVKGREEDTTKEFVNFFGPFDIHGRENILTVTKYNPGLHRMFTSVLINEREKSNEPLAAEIGVRQKEIKADFLTDTDTLDSVADRLLDEFKAPKIELNLKVNTQLSKSVELLDRISVDYPLRLKPSKGKMFMPVVGVTELGDAEEPLPDTFGSLAIKPNLAFKVIQIDDNPKLYTSILKLRQVGKGISDGVINVPGSSILGFAVLGDGTISGAGDTCATWNPSILGAAQVGCTDLST